MKLLLMLSAILATVLTVEGECTIDFSILCRDIRCDPYKDCNVKVPDPCGDCKKFYTCASQGGIPGIFPVSETPEWCPCGLCFSNETRGCHIQVPDITCPTEVPVFEPHTVVNARGSDNDFCLDFDHANLLKGLWVDRLSDFPTTVGHKGLGGLFNGGDSLGMLYFENNQRSKFTWHMWFKRDPSGTGRQGLVCNGDDKHSGSMDLLSVDSSTVRGSISTEPFHALTYITATFADDDWHFVAFVYNGTFLLLYIDDANPVVVAVYRPGLTDRNDCPLFIGRCIINSVNYFFKGVIDEICFYSDAVSRDRLDATRTTGVIPA